MSQPTPPMPIERSAALLTRYEASWAEIAQTNVNICGKARETSAVLTDAASQCEQAATSWAQLRAELQRLPQSVSLMQDVVRSVTAACAQIDALEHRLRDASIARAEQLEGKWRQQQIAEAEAEHRRREEERRMQAKRAEAAALEVQRELEREREQIFQAQFEAQRNYLREHGELETLALRRPEAVAPGSATVSLADVAPCAGDDEELDDFYADDP